MVPDARGIRLTFDTTGLVALREGVVADSLEASYDIRAVLCGCRCGAGLGGGVVDSKGRLGGLDLPNGVRGRSGTRTAESPGSATPRRSCDRRRSRPTTTSWSGADARGGSGSTRASGTQGRATFDAAHQVIESPAGQRWQWDAAGNLLQDDTHRYTWDARGRLVAVTGPEGRTSYGYDALGRRTTATTDGKTVRYVYDGDDVVQQVGADGTRTTYLRGPDGTPLASSTAGVSRPCCRTCSATSARPGARRRVQRFSYDPFGRLGVLRVRGRDSGAARRRSGQLAMGARTYDPSTGRFLSRDSWGIEGGDTDPYRYALGAPTVYTDPSGHAAECVGMALGWAMSALGPGGGWDDYDALEDKADSGQISQDEWSVQADRVSHDIWSGFDVVANVCGTTAVGSSAAALPLLGASKVASRVLGSLADDAVTGAGATRVGQWLVTFGRESANARELTLRAYSQVASVQVHARQCSARPSSTVGLCFDLANKMAHDWPRSAGLGADPRFRAGRRTVLARQQAAVCGAVRRC